jgi:ParB/RepB/Spo0J family partition protein
MKTEIIKEKSESIIQPGKAETLPIDKIQFSPLNYRKYFRQEDLETFAQELRLHGIISPLTVRRIENGIYELVAGERRLRAAKIGKLQSVPVIIRELTDEQVTEIQLAENLQRENPHPLDEANAVKLMQDTGKTIDEISLRLGKPKQFVYVRLKLLNLIEPFKEMFYAEVINLRQSLEIATISADGQTQFFQDHCSKWKQKGFELHNLEWQLRPYKYDLRNAPFDTKDKKLLPEVGACTGCQYNSATMKSLFPEMAKQAICSNISCYRNKCKANVHFQLVAALEHIHPIALLFDGEPTEAMLSILKEMPEAEILARHDYNMITVLQKPEEPEKEDYMYEDDDEKEKFDKKAFGEAMKEYKEELSQYENDIAKGKFSVGLLERGGQFQAVYFSMDKPVRNDYSRNDRGVSMKQVQEAIKTGSATTELLDAALTGIKQREARAKELDRDKVQVSVLDEVKEKACDIANLKGLTEYDRVAARLLVYQSLDYSSRQQVDQTIFKKIKEVNFDVLKKMTDKEYAYLIRMALAGKSDSKFPSSVTGVTLYKVAEAAGVEVRKIEADQKSKAEARGERVKERVKDLNKRKSKLNSSVK